MRRFLGIALAVLFSFTPIYAVAGTRAVVYPAENPRSQDTNGAARFERLDKGTFRREAFGPGVTGTYANLSVVPNGGMYVAVQPSVTNTQGSLYQLMADDQYALPQGSYSPQLAADSTQILVHGMQSGPSSSIGPITAPTSGQSQYYLVEAQIVQQDTNNQSVLFVNSSGGSSYQNVNTNRVDTIVYQLKAGTAGTSPVAPSVDSGWIGIANILVPGGASSISSGMISSSPGFTGFILAGSNVTLQGLTLSSLGAGCVNSNASGVLSSLPCTSGLGTVNGTNPIVATTSGSVATVQCPTCVTSVNGSTNIASTGGTAPTLSLTGSIPYANLPATVAQTGVNNNFSVTQNFQTTPTVNGTPIPTAVASPGLTLSGGTISLSHGDYVDTTSTQTIGGAKRFTSALTVGPSAPGGLTTGDIDANRSATTGAMAIGGATESSTLDFNVSNPNATTLTCNGSGCSSNLVIGGNFTTPNTVVSGQLELQSSTLTTAPYKWMRSNGTTGCMEWVNSAYTSVIATLCDNGNLTATNFYTGSRREWKKNITPYTFDPLSILSQVDYAEYDCKTPECGPVGTHKVGIIANDSPVQISGNKHDHYDAFALAAIDGKAVVELQQQVERLQELVYILLIALLVVAARAAVRRRA